MNIEFDLTELTNFIKELSDNSAFEKSVETATKRLAKALLRWMKAFTPTDSYELINGWNGNNFAVRRANNGFEVLIVNKTPYALAVNDGHRVRNRENGEYYQVKRRVQVRSPHQWQDPSNNWYVFGHFFVERGILRVSSTSEIEQIIFNELQKWWDSL
jgi:hypothetical protein